MLSSSRGAPVRLNGSIAPVLFDARAPIAASPDTPKNSRREKSMFRIIPSLLDFCRMEKMVGDTGLEPEASSGHVVVASIPPHRQTEVSHQLAMDASGHFGSAPGQPKDRSGASSCCAGVAHPPDLEKIISEW